VCGAGDVNGDGYHDIIVGEPLYTHEQPYEGRASVYYGSASGPSSSPDWVAEGNQRNCLLGEVSNAGDVNGDGYDDVIVGASNCSHGQIEEGAVFAYYGSASGLSSSPDWTAESNQGAASFGQSVATAGDVNNDGYDDIIIGAPKYDTYYTDAGRAYVYYGSFDGLIGVEETPKPRHYAYEIDEDMTLSISAPGVLAYDTEPGDDTRTAVLASDASQGTVTLHPDGSFVYTPDANFYTPGGYWGDSFTYKITDGISDSDAGRVNIIVNPVNDAPVAGDNAFTTSEDSELTIPVSALLSDDTDVDSYLSTLAVFSNVSHGTLMIPISGTSSIIYTPDADWNGSDSFTYRAFDGEDYSNLATVTITVEPVNDAPVAADDSYSTDEDVSLVIPASGVVKNDADIDGDSLTAVLVSDVSHGVLTLNTNGSFTYTLAANFNGTDSFTYRIGDGTTESNTATVTITVNPVNDAPVAGNDAYSAIEDRSLAVPASGVLGNDTDTEQVALRAVLVSNVSHGTLTLNPDGSFAYVPAADWSGLDSFTYKTYDGNSSSSVATVTITVIAGPTIESISAPTGSRGNTMKVTILGTGFSEAASISFGEGVVARILTIESPNQIAAEITVTRGAELGPRDVFVATPNGTCTLSGAFVVFVVEDQPSEQQPSDGPLVWVLIPVTLALAGLSFLMFYVMWRTAS